MSPTPESLTRFARLPRNPAEVWQGGLVRLPFWIEQGPAGCRPGRIEVADEECAAYLRRAPTDRLHTQAEGQAKATHPPASVTSYAETPSIPARRNRSMSLPGIAGHSHSAGNAKIDLWTCGSFSSRLAGPSRTVCPVCST